MKLSDYDLQQLDADWLHKRNREELLHVSQKLLEDQGSAGAPQPKFHQHFDKLSASQFRTAWQSSAVVPAWRG